MEHQINPGTRRRSRVTPRPLQADAGRCDLYPSELCFSLVLFDVIMFQAQLLGNHAAVEGDGRVAHGDLHVRSRDELTSPENGSKS